MREGAGRAVSARGRLLFWGLVLLLLAASLPLHLGSPTSDVSWLLSMCERLLAGERAYVDVLEISPPVPMLLYMPPVLIGRVIGVSSEAALLGLVYVLAGLVMALTYRILPRLDSVQERSARAIIVSVTLTLFVFPADAFAQREYFAALFALPMVAIFVRHEQCGDWAPVSARATASVLAALTVAIKPPFFALPGLLIFGAYLWRTRSLGFVLASGLLAAGLLSVAITLASLAWFPDYFGLIWSQIREVYLPTKSHPLNFIVKYEAYAVLMALAATLVLQRGQRECTEVRYLVLAGTGFLATYFIQGKYFSYHAYPPALMLFCALSVAAVARISAQPNAGRAFRPVPALVLSGMIVALQGLLYAGLWNNRQTMRDMTWAAHFESPTAMAVSPIIATSFPFVREFGGVWVDETHSQWVAFFSHSMLAREGLALEVREAMARHHEEDLKRLLDSIGRNSPDILLVNIAPRDAWLIAELEAIDPSFLDNYRTIHEEGIMRVMARRDPPVAGMQEN